MSDPFDDSSWSDLAAELGVETPKAARAPEPIPPAEEFFEEPDPADLAGSLFGEMPSAESPVAESPAAEMTAGETEEPGENEVIELGGTDQEKKRRRRRRRKKRDGEPAETDGEGDDAPEPAVEGVTQPRELLREIIRTWDVPSWDDIVAGLHRPNR